MDGCHWIKLEPRCQYAHFRTRAGEWGWGGGGDFLARNISAFPECVIVDIGIQTHSNCTENKLVHNLSVIRSHVNFISHG